MTLARAASPRSAPASLPRFNAGSLPGLLPPCYHSTPHHADLPAPRSSPSAWNSVYGKSQWVSMDLLKCYHESEGWVFESPWAHSVFRVVSTRLRVGCVARLGWTSRALESPRAAAARQRGHSRVRRRAGLSPRKEEPGSRGVTFPPARPSARSIDSERDQPRRGRVPASIRLRGTRALVPRSPNPRPACSGRGRRRSPSHLCMRDGLDTAPRRPERPRSPAPPAEASAVGRWRTMREPARRPRPAPSVSAASSGVLDAGSRFDPGRACFAPSFIMQESKGQAAPGHPGGGD